MEVLKICYGLFSGVGVGLSVNVICNNFLFSIYSLSYIDWFLKDFLSFILLYNSIINVITKKIINIFNILLVNNMAIYRLFVFLFFFCIFLLFSWIWIIINNILFLILIQIYKISSNWKKKKQKNEIKQNLKKLIKIKTIRVKCS